MFPKLVNGARIIDTFLIAYHIFRSGIDTFHLELIPSRPSKRGVLDDEFRLAIEYMGERSGSAQVSHRIC